MYRLGFLILLVLGAISPARAQSSDAIWRKLIEGRQVVLLVHDATDPQGRDAPDIHLGDCGTQRNLSDAGRYHASVLGDYFRHYGIEIGRMMVSNYCRAVETAELLRLVGFGTSTLLDPISEGAEARQLQSLREWIAEWRGPGNLVLITHPGVVAALTRITPAEGEMVVVTPALDGLSVFGRYRLQP